MTTNTIVLMTALLPTTGHKDLLTWAAALPDNNVYVMLSVRSFEPIKGDLRREAVEASLSSFHNVTVRLHEEDLAPQNPPDHPHFWSWWSNAINQLFPEVEGAWDFVVASEPYGIQVARSLGAHFMPYDIKRELNPIQSTAVRREPLLHWNALLPTLQQRYQKRIVLFGQESVGKTTMSKALAKRLDAVWLPEWARPYLETVGSHLDEGVMERIYKGQAALQEKAYKEASRPFLVMDTDLFSTVGYRAIGGYFPSDRLERAAHRLVASSYFLLPDDVPFETDELRYGGNVRESSYEFWKSLLEEHHLPYVEIPKGPMSSKLRFMEEEANRCFTDAWQPIADFERE